MDRIVHVVLLALALAAAPVHDPEILGSIGSVGELEFVFPHDGPTEFVDTWGAGRPGGRRHRGTDLMADKMTPVLAAAPGVVDTVDEGRTAGRFIRIIHPGGWETWYMHLNDDTPGSDDGRADWSDTVAPGIEPGAFVQAGQVIGYVGDSGNAERTGSHTHFELHDPSGRINPYPYLVEAFAEYQSHVAELDRLARITVIR